MLMPRFEKRCMICGCLNDLEEHHIETRGAHPELVNDPYNKVWLCKWRCHIPGVHSRPEYQMELMEKLSFYPEQVDWFTRHPFKYWLKYCDKFRPDLLTI